MHVGDRLQQFINYTKLSNRAFAKRVGFTNGVISQIVSGKTLSFGIDKVVSIFSTYPELNIEWLLTGEGSMFKNSELPTFKNSDIISIHLKEGEQGISGIEQFQDSNKKNKQPIKQPIEQPKSDLKDLRVLSITVDSNNEENIEIVPVRAAASYINNIAEPIYLQQLQRFSLPIPEFKQGTFRAFEVEGHSMFPTFQPGELVICKFVDDLIAKIHNHQPYIIVTHESILLKRVLNRLGSDRFIECLSDNSEFSSFTIKYSEIQQVWQVKGSLRFSQHLGDGRSIAEDNQFKHEFIEYKQKVDYLYQHFNNNQLDFE